MDTRELCQLLASRLADRVGELAPELLPNGRRHGGYWRTGSIADEPGESLALNLNGPNVGMWTDFAACEGARGRSGDMLGLVAAVMFGGRIGDAIAWAKSRLGFDDMDPARLRAERAQAVERRQSAEAEQAAMIEKRRRQAVGLWVGAKPLEGSPAELYLASRAIDLSTIDTVSRALRYHPECWNSEAQRPLPALVAAVVSLEGEHVATHRIWIEPDGQGLARKHSGLAEPKKALGRFWEAHIPLNKGDQRCTLRDVKAGTHVDISEGIEDGLTVACACPDRRIVAAVTLGNIGVIRLPEQVRGVTIVAQRDAPGSKAAVTLEKVIGQLQQGGRTVRRALPPEGVKDANDLAKLSFVPPAERMPAHASL